MYHILRQQWIYFEYKLMIRNNISKYGKTKNYKLFGLVCHTRLM